MRFASHDELNWARWIRQDANQPLWIMQEHVQALVRRESAGKSERQVMLVENVRGVFDLLATSAFIRPFLCKAPAP
jgi:hypothetical protein